MLKRLRNKIKRKSDLEAINKLTDVLGQLIIDEDQLPMAEEAKYTNAFNEDERQEIKWKILAIIRDFK